MTATDADLAAAFVRRQLGPDAADVLDALGLGQPLPAKCPKCGYKRTNTNHKVLCS